MILLTHAYSRANQGDSLMVDQALAFIRRILPDNRTVVVGASDAPSFLDLPEVCQIPGITGSNRSREAAEVVRAILQTALTGRMRYPLYDRYRDQTRLVIGVGGGYLRSSHMRESFKSGIAHLSQLLWTATSGLPSLYLPQSIGPLHGPVGAAIRSALRHIGCICLRDNRSMHELSAYPNIMRAPDMAIFELFRNENLYTPPRARKIYLIARDLPRSRHIRSGYIRRLEQLRALLPDLEILTQSAVRSNDDTRFYRALGWGDKFRTTQDVVAAKDHGVVISVRLHGALQALIGGMPAIHLMYERKGFGAYHDIGLPNHVYSAVAFDPEQVVRQARALQRDASRFWLQVGAQRAYVEMAEERLAGMLRRLYGTAHKMPDRMEMAHAG